MDYKGIIYKPGRIARISFNKPRKHNPMSKRMLEEFDHALFDCEQNPDCRVIVVSGEGPSFSCGHDFTEDELKESKGRLLEEWMDEETGKTKERMRYLVERRIAKPTIAMVQGYCMYLGATIAVAMDIVFAAEDVQFLFAISQFHMLVMECGHRKAKEILFEHRFIPAREAKEIGIVNRVFKKEKLEKETLAYAERVADWIDNCNISSVKQGKTMINYMTDLTFHLPQVLGSFDPYFLSVTEQKPEYYNVAVSDEELKKVGRGYTRTSQAIENLRLKEESEKD